MWSLKDQSFNRRLINVLFYKIEVARQNGQDSGVAIALMGHLKLLDPQGTRLNINISSALSIQALFYSLSPKYRFTSHQSSLDLKEMSKYTLKWGILATGGIAESFGRDLSVNPETRNIKDIEHVIVAAASSSSADRAKAYLKEVNAPDSAKAYGSYKDLVADGNVDIIYVATPHSHHYQNAMLCLEAGKNVLCEKSLTVNAAQTEALIKKAREKNVFLMEAVSISRSV